MIVTKENFAEAKRQFAEILPKASFIAFDEEMTGIFIHDDRDSDGTDAVEERYARSKRAADRYHIIQLGIALFVPSDESGTGEYLAHTFNFFMYPNKDSSRDVVLSPATTHFLAEHKMDFNTWIKCGVSYVNDEQASEKRDKFERNWSSNTTTDTKVLRGPSDSKIKLTAQSDIEFIDSTMASIEEWMTNDSSAGNTKLLKPANAFLRRVIYERVEENFPDLIVEKSSDNRNQLQVLRLSEDEKKARWERNRLEAKSKLELDIGVFSIFELLQKECTSRDVPVIVHNGMMDMLFLLTHFVAGPLDKYAQFCEQMQKTFPIVYDTKVLAERYQEDKILSSKLNGEGKPAIQNSTWSSVLEYLVADLQKMHAESNSERKGVALHGENGETSGNYHSASYDAYMTGIAYYHFKIGDCCNGSACFGTRGCRNMIYLFRRRSSTLLKYFDLEKFTASTSSSNQTDDSNCDEKAMEVETEGNTPVNGSVKRKADAVSIS
mmetsp:Transcript_5781/g.8447  ORF Transcript_5781/g.8447 Transcript_5781/m.8447 type:complete len:493 (+) Transcript_5781:146-1624(+)|eukprot:CAMPEP_0196815592 /NCGR_PEP_ID=MMETSP1362-20130617/50696_1 /TAXON_ID=163516 /ORGANISM="Leptocylindrus danicus, Strain CCMP1856" /LENGTH=492 /DNA_ID=CAMNT_0042192613 /DNA_START=99 /DNA_END=1577 /DNA_ORIENTATION=-